MGIKLQGDVLRKLQLEILDILIEFDRICRKHHIQYYLSCGTLLGAVRHHGFIPWDDDADVELPRSEYDKFRRVVKEEIGEGFFFQDTATDANYRWPYGKMRKKNTRYAREGQNHLGQQDGICIDVFPLDEIPDDFEIQKKMARKARYCRKALWAAVGAVNLTDEVEKFKFSLLNGIPRDFALEKYLEAVACYQGQNMSCYGFFNTEAIPEFSFIYQKEWYSKPLELDFEGHKFFVPNGYDHILSLKYGDYLALPPKEKQKGNWDAEYIKLSDGTELFMDK